MWSEMHYKAMYWSCCYDMTPDIKNSPHHLLPEKGRVNNYIENSALLLFLLTSAKSTLNLYFYF